MFPVLFRLLMADNLNGMFGATLAIEGSILFARSVAELIRSSITLITSPTVPENVGNTSFPRVYPVYILDPYHSNNIIGPGKTNLNS
jgi:hypothetical protein